LTNIDALEEAVGSIRQARGILRRVVGEDAWQKTAEERQTELLIYLALEKINGRPKFTDLPEELQLDIKAFFSSYKAACAQADDILYVAGDPDQRLAAMHESPVGKLTGKALYVHESALHELPATLRIYEGCARQYVGDTEGGNVIKLSRESAKISYLQYPDFRKHPHPAIRGSLVVPLGRPHIRYRDYSHHANPGILHRKEKLVSRQDPKRATYERLTRQEERWGLLSDPPNIGTTRGWHEALHSRGVTLRGHRLVTRTTPTFRDC
jgi:DNA phosphorothioation-associated putative methyltransferase